MSIREESNGTWTSQFWYRDYNGDQRHKTKRGFKTKAMQRVATAIVTLSIIFTVFIGTCTLFSPNRYDSIKACNPELYEQAHSLFD